jgi:hypothetical protein
MSWLIRAQADDFFAAYQVLTKSGPTIGSPAVVNLAFALELYIKDLHVVLCDEKDKKKVKAPRGHNILELFRKLPLESQQEIRNYPAIQKLVSFYSMQTPFYIPQDRNKQPITDVLEQEIYKISDSFQKWRYSYESKALQYEESTALTLIEAIKFTADNARKKLAA